MSVLTLGGAAIQLPLGRLSDHMDRRFVILGICLASAVVGTALYFLAGSGRTNLLILIGLFGITALPFYGLSVAHEYLAADDGRAYVGGPRGVDNRGVRVEARQQVRAMVEDAGGAFFLVHVATPLEECERRDRKGLYAKARAGEIPEFTGISSPYEEPTDAAVRVDTTGRTIGAALDDVLLTLQDAGYLELVEGAENTST